ncbi:MAG: class I SAM-dependent methyltransferase [Phycisphaerales bacterium]
MDDAAYAEALQRRLDRDEPLDLAEHDAQLTGLLDGLAPGSRVLDLGCGGGRLLVPLAAAGHQLTGLDHDADALADCRASLAALGPGAAQATLIEGKLPDPASWPEGPFDAVLCLGHTFMLLPEPGDAVAFLRAAGERLDGGAGSDAAIWLDDLPGMLWPLLVTGDWIEGVSDDGEAQLLWERRDAVMALRRDQQVRPDDWTIGTSDVRWRLWTDGMFELAASAAGLSAPEPRASECLMILRAGKG